MAKTEKTGLRLPAALIIMDGFGLAPEGPYNAISQAHTPCLDALMRDCPFVPLNASGPFVGLPDQQMGNSEVGHLTIGAGRVIDQELTRINKVCAAGALGENHVLKQAFELAKAGTGRVHFMGLLSHGGVHSSQDHLYALIDAARAADIPEVFVHGFMDGRDVDPEQGVHDVQELKDAIAAYSSTNAATKIHVATLIGRYYAMDRDSRWERVEHAWELLQHGVSADPAHAADPCDYLKSQYAQGIQDEFIQAAAFNYQGMEPKDVVVFFNFRPDRARELSRALCDSAFEGFVRENLIPVQLFTLTEYDERFDFPVIFKKEFPQEVLAEVLERAGLTQYHSAETEKYAHVTFFMNGGREEPYPHEIRKLIPSPSVATYDLKPEMSAPELTCSLVEAIESDTADVYIVNYANCDMVGHTGNLAAAIQAVEEVDRGLACVLDALHAKGGVALISADHGNADCMVQETGKPLTSHTTNVVPLIMTGMPEGFGLKSKEEASLANIAPTLLDMIGLDKPESMESESLLERSE